MAEYKSFHYLMHAVPEQIKPHYIQAAKPLSFSELYSPREGTISLGKHEKSYWRTRDRIEFGIYEDRSHKVVFVTCRNIDNSEIYRTIFLCAETLFFEVDLKARETESREKLVRKKDKVLNTDELLHKAAVDYILARLLITNDLLPWPDFAIPPPAEPTIQSEPSTPVKKDSPEVTIDQQSDPVGPLEKMCTFSKVSSDKYLYLEINKPPALSLEGIPHVKTVPSVAKLESALTPVPQVSSTTSANAVSIPATLFADNGTNETANTLAVGSVRISNNGSAPASAPSSAPTSARLNVPTLKLSGSRKTTRAPISQPAPTLAVASTLIPVPDSAAAPSATLPVSTAISSDAEGASVAATGSASNKKAPSSSTPSSGKMTNSGLSKSRSTVVVKQSSTPTSAKNSSASTVAKGAAVKAVETETESPADGATTAATTEVNSSAVKPKTTSTKISSTSATVGASATTSLLDTAVNPTERNKSVAASPSAQRNSILGSRNSNKVVPT